MDNDLEQNKKASRWWLILPVLFGIIGGIIAYFIVRNRDRDFAKTLLIVGGVMTVILPIIAIILTGFVFITSKSGPSSPLTSGSGFSLSGIELLNSSCNAGTKAVITLRNIGVESIKTNDIVVTRTSGNGIASLSWSQQNLDPGLSVNLTDSSCTTIGNPSKCSYDITLPQIAKTATVTVNCNG